MNDRKANRDCLERENKINMSLITRFIIIVTIIVSIVDGAFLYCKIGNQISGNFNLDISFLLEIKVK